MANQRNEGVINRGNITAGALAVGHGASASQVSPMRTPPEEFQKVEEQLKHLLKLLAEQGHAIPNCKDVVQSAEKVKEELSQEKPSKLTITSLLDGIAGAVSSVGTIATAVEGIKAAIGALF